MLGVRSYMSAKIRFIIEQKKPSHKVLKTAKSFSAGEILIDLVGAKVISTPDYMTIDLGDRHVYHPFGRYINHSCEPNAYVDVEQHKLFASCDIEQDDEITFNYLISERQITAPFDCNCGSSNCLGRIETKFEEVG